MGWSGVPGFVLMAADGTPLTGLPASLAF